jgi:hypothetical protein
MSDPKKRGGKRPGAGRKKKARSGVTVDGIDLQAAIAAVPPSEIETAAAPYARMAINSLYKQLIGGASETAKVSAANAILDRGYGRPAVEIGGDALLPFQAVPAAPSLSTEIRAEARKYALLAIEVLRRIADVGASESARVQAVKTLLDRGLGAVAPARNLDKLFERPAGKKEAAERGAEEALTGIYSPRTPPKALQ